MSCKLMDVFYKKEISFLQISIYINFPTKGHEGRWLKMLEMEISASYITDLLMNTSLDNWRIFGLYAKQLEERGLALFPKVFFRTSYLNHQD